MKLELKNVSFSYDNKKEVLKDINLTVNKGSVMTILGRNGAGKSTMLNCITGGLKPTKGEIFLDGKEISSMSYQELAKVIAYVPQNHTTTYPYMVKDLVVMGRAPYLKLYEKPSKKDFELVNEVLEELGILHLADRLYTEISGGERQKVTVARAIVQQADIIILDEPTSQLDYGNQLRLVSQVSTLVKRGFGVIMTTHMPDHVFLVGGEVAILDKKGNLNVGKVDDVMTNEALSELYESEINIVEVKEFNRKICIASDW